MVTDLSAHTSHVTRHTSQVVVTDLSVQLDEKEVCVVVMMMMMMMMIMMIDDGDCDYKCDVVAGGGFEEKCGRFGGEGGDGSAGERNSAVDVYNQRETR